MADPDVELKSRGLKFSAQEWVQSKCECVCMCVCVCPRVYMHVHPHACARRRERVERKVR